MSRKGHYLGGGTTIGRKDVSWWSKPKPGKRGGSTRTPRRRPSLTEKAFNDYHAKRREKDGDPYGSPESLVQHQSLAAGE
jgi:hypothetical protein